MKRSVVIAAASLFVLAVATAVLAADDPFVGTWKANIEKSTKPKNPPAKSMISKIEPAKNGLKISMDTVNATGNARHVEWTATFDGKDNQYTTPGVVVACARYDDYRFACVMKQDGKELTRMFDVVSSDGKTGTLVFVNRTTQGQEYVDTIVSDKQ